MHFALTDQTTLCENVSIMFLISYQSLHCLSLTDMPASHGVPQLQMELVRSCMVDVLEEFQDEMNSRLVHLQYIITKKFIQQQVSASKVTDISSRLW